MAFYAGKKGVCTVASSNAAGVSSSGNPLPIKSWKATFNKDELDTTNLTSSGKRTFQRGFCHVEFTLEGEWDASVNPFDTAGDFSVQSGSYLGDLQLWTQDTDNDPTFSIDTAFVSKVDLDMTAEAIVKYTITGKSSGGFSVNGSGAG